MVYTIHKIAHPLDSESGQVCLKKNNSGVGWPSKNGEPENVLVSLCACVLVCLCLGGFCKASERPNVEIWEFENVRM